VITDKASYMATKKEEREELHKWFFSLWDERSDNEGVVICFETGKRLKPEYYKYKLTCYSHILPKSKYPQYRMNKENVVIVHPDSHEQYEVYPEKTPNQNNLKKLLIKRHIEGTL